MSDPVKSSEIEDVLSSIRRLVSEDARVSQGEVRDEGHIDRDAVRSAEQKPDTENAPELLPDALVLTPALRIHDGGQSPEPANANSASAGDVQKREEEAAEPLEPAEDLGAQLAEDAAPANFREGLRDVVMGALADVALEEGKQHSETSQDAVGGNEVSDAPEDNGQTASHMSWADEAALSDEPPVTVAQVVDDGGTQSDQADAAPTVENSEDIRAADETPLEWEDHADETAKTDFKHHQEDAIDLEGDESVQTADVGADDPADDGDLDNVALDFDEQELSTIDEAALREMVVDIVREELQGALGERITRNVRRLVRREIHRALASQELN